MMFSARLIPLVALTVVSLTNASPLSIAKGSPSLLKRTSTINNCDSTLPVPDGANRLITQKDLLTRAFADMATLADSGSKELNSKGSGSPAFQHYFLPADLDHVMRLFGAVAEGNNPTNSPFDVILDCTPVNQCTSKVYAVTSPQPESGGPRKMTICPAFFTADWATADYLLPTDPNDSDKQTFWCESEYGDANTQSYRKFVSAGHTLLHEITHLDKVGAFLENGLDNRGGHGTFDYVTLDGEAPEEENPGVDELWLARQLQILWVTNGNRDDTRDPANQVVAPVRNAESFAGSATESFFMKFCGVSSIAPNTGVGPDDDEADPESDPDWDGP